MGMVVLVAHQDSLAGSSHSMEAIVLFKALEPCQNRRILFRLCLLGAEGIVRQRIQPDSLRLLSGEVLRDNGPRRFVLGRIAISEFHPYYLRKSTDRSLLRGSSHFDEAIVVIVENGELSKAPMSLSLISVDRLPKFNCGTSSIQLSKNN